MSRERERKVKKKKKTCGVRLGTCIDVGKNKEKEDGDCVFK